MQQPWWVSVIGIIVGAAIAGIIAHFSQRRLQKDKIELEEKLKLRGSIFQQNLDKIVQFIENPGLEVLLRFFSDPSTPKELLNQLGKLTAIDQRYEEMKVGFGNIREELENMRKRLTDRLFNPVMAAMYNGIESNRTFTSRLQEDSESKKYIKDHWLDIQDVQLLLRNEDSIFIESGSTLAYCMLSIIAKIDKYRVSCTPLRVCTNNVAIYMMLLFDKRFEPILLPGRPDNKYAATFADIAEDGAHSDEISKFLEQHNVRVVFTTASYLDVDYGPHVGSIQNHTMKRILNNFTKKHDCKNIFVIAAEKINRAVLEEKIESKCLLIFDPNRTEDVLQHRDILDAAKRAWGDYLNNSNTCIISGSCDKGLCNSKIDEFTEQYKLNPYILEKDDRGDLFKLQKYP